jgi:UDP-N-acetylmuramoyl-L-alanyl-D-glutamate--2,6-diaminopimelate ligase
MPLKTLVSQLNAARIDGPLERDVAGIAYDSRRVKPGFVFVAMRGEKADGHDFIATAAEQGASAIVCEEAQPAGGATVIVVPDSRAALATIAATFFKHPSHHLKLAGVTGTNGKTTTTFLLKHMCETAMLRCGLIGTVRYEIGERILPASRTTPESLDLQEMLFQMRSAGCKAAVMEVSSHALSQERVRDIEFDVAVFTNLTQDHLDYHKTMENYFEAKSRLFSVLLTQVKKKGKAVINMDDPYGAQLAARFAKDLPVITFGVGARCDFRASNQKIDFQGASYQLDALDKSFLVRLPLIGRFNIYNSLGALAAASALGLDLRAAVLSLATAPAVPGRLEPVPAKRQFRIFVDYAHTDDALLNVINTLRELSPNRLIVVFGCGGNRDRAKRPLMGAVVDRLADYAIITSDNPRKEQPEAIIEDIKRGFHGSNYEAVVDRKEAIFRAVAMAQPRDIVLIAGKGHENYQEFADRTVPFDDVSVAKLALEARPVEMKR